MRHISTWLFLIMISPGAIGCKRLDAQPLNLSLAGFFAHFFLHAVLPQGLRSRSRSGVDPVDLSRTISWSEQSILFPHHTVRALCSSLLLLPPLTLMPTNV